MELLNVCKAFRYPINYKFENKIFEYLTEFKHINVLEASLLDIQFVGWTSKQTLF